MNPVTSTTSAVASRVTNATSDLGNVGKDLTDIGKEVWDIARVETAGARQKLTRQQRLNKAMNRAQNVGMADLIRRADKVWRSCGGGEDKDANEGDEPTDAFGHIKLDIARTLKRLRQLIKERDEELGTNGNSSSSIQKSQAIRKAISDLKQNYRQIQEVHAKMSKKKRLRKQTKEEEDAIVKRMEQIELIGRHIKEVEALDKRRFVDQRNSAADRFGGGGSSAAGGRGGGGSGGAGGRSGGGGRGGSSRQDGGGGEGSGSNDNSNITFGDLPNDPEDSNLPDIDISDSLMQIQAKNEMIDQGLEDLSQGVKRLGEMARGMNEEIQKQNIQLAEVEEKIEINAEKMATLNSKLKNTLERVGGTQRLIVLIILLILIVIVIGVCYFLFKNFVGVNF